MHSIIDDLIKKGNEIISNIPKKTKLSQIETNLKEKSAKDPKVKAKIELQLRILKEEQDQKLKNIQQKYSEWYNECSDLIKKTDKKSYFDELAKTKHNLALDLRIKALTYLLNQIKKESKSNFEGSKEQDIEVEKLISDGENNKVEFKSSLRWDWKLNQLNKNLDIAISKAISAFLNSHGGILLVGVNDNGEVLGLEKDYSTLKRQDGDGFIQFLVQVMNNKLGKEYNQYISSHIKNISGKGICIIKIIPSSNPVFIKYDNKEEFYIRASSTSQPLNVREATEYIKMHWK